MKASATARLAGGRGKELLIQVYIYHSQSCYGNGTFKTDDDIS